MITFFQHSMYEKLYASTTRQNVTTCAVWSTIRHRLHWHIHCTLRTIKHIVNYWLQNQKQLMQCNGYLLFFLRHFGSDSLSISFESLLFSCRKSQSLIVTVCSGQSHEISHFHLLVDIGNEKKIKWDWHWLRKESTWLCEEVPYKFHNVLAVESGEQTIGKNLKIFL